VVDGGGGGGSAAGVTSELVKTLLERIEALEARLAAVERERDEYRKLYLLAREEIAQLKRGLLGQKAHRAPKDEGQLSMFLLELAMGLEGGDDDDRLRQRVPAHERRKPVRKPLPEHLPRVRIELLPPEVEREGLNAFEEIGAESREVIERRPASVVVVEVVKKKFVRKAEREALSTEVLVADTPELPIPRGMAGPGMLADSIVKRWQDHLALHRMEAIFRREGIDLNRSTLCGWHIELAELVEPLIEAMHADALKQPYVCVDATGVLVQDRERCRNGHFWVLVAPPKHTLFQFSDKHDGAAVDRLLPDYRGIVVADAHLVYDHIYGPEKATEAGCWSHMRKYFLDALRVDPILVREPFQLIQTLFVIERGIKRAPPPEREKIRREKSAPVVEAFFDWCERHREHALDESPLHVAIRYAMNQREALGRFIGAARLPMHNNVSERELRRQAVGRKAWLFVGSEDGARANTTFVSLLASCAMHGIEPWVYLRDLFCLLPSWPMSRVLELAPANWSTLLQDPEVQERLDQNIFRRATLLPASPNAQHAAA
jgi:transposase